MKPSAFDLVRPTSLPEALTALGSGNAAPLAGGQSLLVLLRLRLAGAETLVEIARLPELSGAEAMADRVRYGAATTHAAFEDGLVPDASAGLMRRVAAGIAYRAVRNLGTIGGSLALADPSADWPCCLLALDACAVLRGPNGERRVPLDAFLISAFVTDLQPAEMVAAVEIPHLPQDARWGYAKLARKHGAFADSLAACTRVAGGAARVVLGATATRAVRLARTEAALDAGTATDAALAADVAEADPDADAYRARCHQATVRRALREMAA